MGKYRLLCALSNECAWAEEIAQSRDGCEQCNVVSSSGFAVSFMPPCLQEIKAQLGNRSGSTEVFHLKKEPLRGKWNMKSCKCSCFFIRWSKFEEEVR